MFNRFVPRSMTRQGDALGRSLLAACLALGLAAVPDAQAAAVPGQGTWETSLQARDLDADGVADAYYDVDQQITWLADANVGGKPMTFEAAKSFAKNYSRGGWTGWRLPKMRDTGLGGCNFDYEGTDCGYNVDTSHNELAYLFYVTLGNKAFYDTTGHASQPGWGLSNTGPFDHILGYIWFKTPYKPLAGYAWEFDMTSGGQSFRLRSSGYGAWLVHDGDVGAPL